jgi:hypothetical protein
MMGAGVGVGYMGRRESAQIFGCQGIRPFLYLRPPASVKEPPLWRRITALLGVSVRPRQFPGVTDQLKRGLWSIVQQGKFVTGPEIIYILMCMDAGAAQGNALAF